MLVVLLVAVVGGVVWQVLRQREPVYLGRPLSIWLEGYTSRAGASPDRQEAEAAVYHAGTNALPMLLAMLGSEDSRFQQRFQGLIRGLPLVRFHFTSPTHRHYRALFALDTLGPAAAPAVPRLIQMLQGTNTEIKCCAAQALGSLGAEERVIVPALTNVLHDRDYMVRESIAENLGRIRKEPAVAIPALTGQLIACTNTTEFLAVSLALSKFGTNAGPAVPTLLQRLADPNSVVRHAAADALIAMDPEAAAKAGVK
ncbi:MAG: lyase domain protein repeat-containing protein [Pedosphaera sp.]|nr:lyase domain protein repeat-containing protein [Pedosphaera sp.]